MNGSLFTTLEEAVLCFYQSNNVLQSEAQKWLTELQNSPQIWNIIWEELLPSKRTEVQFYGATILHSKLLKDWAEVPVDQYEALKTKLLEAVVYFKEGPKIVLNRLCISLAVYILRVAHIYWPNAVAELISIFQNASLFQNVPNATPEKLTYLLLEILTVIPEEFQTILLTKNEKVFVNSALEADNLTVLALVEVALTSSDIGVKLQAVKCSKSWLEFGLPLESCDGLLNLLIKTVLETYKISNFTHFENFQNGITSSAQSLQCKEVDVSQCCVNAIEAISILCNHENMMKHPKRVVSYLGNILLLAEILNTSQEEIINSDLIPCLYTLFVSFGEVHIKILTKTLLTTERDVFLKLVHLILRCSNAPGFYPRDEIYSTQAFSFWYFLQDEIISNELDKNEEILNNIKPFYKELILVLMKKSMFPKDIEDWSLDEKDMFRCYRQDIADTYTYCYAILNHELLDIIEYHLEQATHDPNIITEWRKVDSYLHAFHSISENVINGENSRILHCILLLEKLPLSNMNVQVSQIVMELLGSYAEWLYAHPELLLTVLSLVFRAAEDPRLAPPATLALKDITRECKSVIHPYAEGIADKTMYLLKQGHLRPSEEQRLVFSLGTVLSLLPKETILKYLKEVVSPYIVKLDNILSTIQEDPQKTESEIIDITSRLTQLFLALDVKPPEPVLCLLQEVLPRFKAVLLHFRRDQVISSLCVTIKCAICNLGESCSELVPVIVDLVLTTYHHDPNKEWFDLAKQLLLLFGNNVSCAQLMSDMLKRICEVTLSTFENTTPENVSQHTSLFEHFYSFCTNVLKKNCKLLLNTAGVNLVSLFRFAGFALCAQENMTVKSASLFLSNIITISREQDALLIIVQTHGAELVYNILIAIGKVSPRNCLEHVADVLVALSKKYCDWLSRWLNEILTPEGFPSPRATSDAKKRFIQTVLREKANKRRVHDSTKEFSFLCRGLLNKDYINISSSAL